MHVSAVRGISGGQIGARDQNHKSGDVVRAHTNACIYNDARFHMHPLKRANPARAEWTGLT